MFYVRHFSNGVTAQKSFADKQQAWAYAQKVSCFDIYDTSVRHTVMGTFKFSHYVAGTGKQADEVTEFCRTLDAARRAYCRLGDKEHTCWLLEEWDVKSHSWKTIAGSVK